MKFTDSLWDNISEIYSKILDLPFNKELTRGTLPADTFGFYIKQDSLYLEDFSKALAITGAKSNTAGELLDFLDFAKGAVVVERALHDGFLKTFDSHIDVEKSPACLSYTAFLLATASTEDYPVAVASLLPCFWIYREAGLHIHQRASDKNRYREWINTYAGEDFSESVDRAIEITDRVAENSSNATREQMTEAFIQSTRLEWIFWDSAYRLERWPV